MSKKSDTKLEAPEIEKPFDFDTFELNTREDYKIWNLHAHKAFREAKKMNPKCDPPIPARVPGESFHKKLKVKFQRFDQQENVLKACVRNEDIHWEGQLKPGCTYELPLPVVKFLNRLVVPVFEEVKVENNGGGVRTETKQTGEKARFSCQLLDLE